MDPFFFRVEHDLLRSESFKSLGGSAIKVYLVIGLYADFGTGWAYPGIRTIASQAGLSRQTVLAAIQDLTQLGLLATSKTKGRSTAYRIMQAPPGRANGRKTRAVQPAQTAAATGPESFQVGRGSGPKSYEPPREPGPKSYDELAQFFGPGGPGDGPEREQGTKEDSPSIPIPGTPFRLTSGGRLVVAADLQSLLRDQGVPERVAQKLVAEHSADAIAKVLLNAMYLQSQGRLQNGPGYVRAGIEAGYDLLPQVSGRLDARRRELEVEIRMAEARRQKEQALKTKAEEDAAIALVIESLRLEQVEELVRRAVALLPEPIVRRNPTLTNPFVRGKVYELAGGDPIA